jgi:hypothetical protein
MVRTFTEHQSLSFPSDIQNDDRRQITPLSGHREEVQGVWDTRAGTAEPFRPTSVSQVSHVPGQPGRTATGIAGFWSFRRRHCGVPSVAQRAMRDTSAGQGLRAVPNGTDRRFGNVRDDERALGNKPIAQPEFYRL